MELGLEFYWDRPWDRRNAFWVIWTGRRYTGFESAPQSVVCRTRAWTSGEAHEKKVCWVSGPAQTYWVRTCSSKRCPSDTNAYSNWTGTGLDCPLGEGISALLLWREIRGGTTLIQECVENLKTGRLSQKDFWIRMFIEGTSLVHAANAGGSGLIPGQGLRLHRLSPVAKRLKIKKVHWIRVWIRKRKYLVKTIRRKCIALKNYISDECLKALIGSLKVFIIHLGKINYKIICSVWYLPCVFNIHLKIITQTLKKVV